MHKFLCRVLKKVPLAPQVRLLRDGFDVMCYVAFKKNMSLSEVFALFNRSSLGYISNIYLGFSKFRVINGEYVVKISRDIVELVYEVKPFGFLGFDIKFFS